MESCGLFVRTRSISNDRVKFPKGEGVARIAGVDIPRVKQARIALTYIYGVGPNISREILKKAQVGEEIRMKDLT